MISYVWPSHDSVVKIAVLTDVTEGHLTCGVEAYCESPHCLAVRRDWRDSDEDVSRMDMPPLTLRTWNIAKAHEVFTHLDMQRVGPEVSQLLAIVSLLQNVVSPFVRCAPARILLSDVCAV